jgi:hypothetical protein
MILRSYGTVLILWALVLFLPIVSPAQVPLDQSVTQPVDAALGLVQGTAKPKPKPISAPEIDVDAAAGVFIIAAGTLMLLQERWRRP